MEECRKAKLVNMDLYRNLNKEVRKKCKKAKDDWLNEQCDETEVNPRNIHQKIKDIVYKKRVASGHCIQESCAIAKTTARCALYTEWSKKAVPQF